MYDLDLNKSIKEIVGFIRQQLNKAGFNKLIVGLSGGIDSAVTAALCVEAVGSENVTGVLMPYRASSSDSIEHAILVADKYKIKYKVIEITSMVDAYFDTYEPDADKLRKGNRMARERMCILYDLSAKYGALVAGTGNKSELMIGYCTQYGDSACAFEPLGDLYKTEVKDIAELLGIPEIIINKNPTADLWEGQTDEDEMGISYSLLDKILYNLMEEKKDAEELIEMGFSSEKIKKVLQMIKRSEFKRKMPPVKSRMLKEKV